MLMADNLWRVTALNGTWNFIQANVHGIAVSGGNVGFSLFYFTSESGAPE